MGGEEALAKLSEVIKEAVHSPRLQTVQILEASRTDRAPHQGHPRLVPGHEGWGGGGAALGQAKELRRTLEELGEVLGD